MFAYPKQAKFNRVVPKNKIYVHAKPSKRVRELFVSEVGEKLAGGVLQRQDLEICEGGVHEKGEIWKLKGLECQPDQIGNEVEVGIVAEQGEIEFRRERGNPEVVSGDGSATGFKVKPKVGVVVGRGVRGRMDFSERQVLSQLLLVAPPVGGLADAVVVFSQNNCRDYQSRGLSKR